MEVLLENLGEDLIDETTKDYISDMFNDVNSSDEDVVESVLPLLQSFYDNFSEEQLRQWIELTIQTIRHDKKTEPEQKQLSQPVLLADVTQSQDAEVKAAMNDLLSTQVNFNKQMDAHETTAEIDHNLSQREIRILIQGEKKQARAERRGKIREQHYAMQRDEMLAVLKSRPVKLHESGFAGGGGYVRDIVLQNISIHLPNLELLTDCNVTFVDGRKYGLVGRNGIGKTTFLKYMSSHAFPAIPKHLQILHIYQEVAPTSTSVLETVLQTDIERDTLIRESALIEQLMAPAVETVFETFEEETTVDVSSAENNTNDDIDDQRNASATRAPTSVLSHDVLGVVFSFLTDKELMNAKLVCKRFNAIGGPQLWLRVFNLTNLTITELSSRLVDVYDRLTQIEADRAVSQAMTILSGLGFSSESMHEPTKNFSGGWRMRVSLAQALFISPDILLLDEPTNHLDLHSVMWLENFLNNWKHTLIVVSHDRGFLNNVVTDIIEFRNKTLTRYKGNYDTFTILKYEKLKLQSMQNEQQEKQRAKLQNFVDKNRASASTAKMAQSRVKMLEKMQSTSAPTTDPKLKIMIPDPGPLQGVVVQLTDVAFGYGEAPALFSNVHFNVRMGTRVAIVGDNGVGKSTLLKLIYGDLKARSGQVFVNSRAVMSRFTQHHMDLLDMKKSPLQFLQDLNPKVKAETIRKHLGQVGVHGALQLQPIYSLSGGQKSRVALAYVTWNKPHVLLLDEPSNHLDMETIDALIEALNEYDGALIIVSHDSYFISSVCDEIWVCEKHGVQKFNGFFSPPFFFSLYELKIIFAGDFSDYRSQVQKKNKLL